MISFHILQYSSSIMTGSATVCCCIDCIDCIAEDSWMKCTKVMSVATVCTEMVLQWHCLLNNVLCSTAIDCCSAFRHKLLDTERSVTSVPVMTKGPNIAHSSLTVCTQLLLTSAEFLHNKPHNNLLSTSCCKQ